MTQLMAAAPVGDHVTRMLLLSDGATNHGIKDLPGLRSLAARMRDRGCSISTIGVDVDFDEKVMAAIASESNGRHYFVANASELPAVFSQEFDALLSSVARESELAIDLAPGVEVEQVFDRSFRRESPTRIVVPFGTFAAKQEKTVLIKLKVPADREGVQQVAGLKLSYRDLVERQNGNCQGELALNVTTDGSAQKDLDPFVAARLERSKTAQTLTEANDLFQQGRVSEAKAKLAAQDAELKKTGALAHTSVRARASRAPGGKGLDALDGDFAAQRQAVAEAESTFGAAAAAPAATATGRGGFANATPQAATPPPAESRVGKAGVRANQERASALGF
jgi:Ca-activated chloride channel family protein